MNQQKNAFIIAFYYLLRSSEMDPQTMFSSAIRNVISYGGSITTNAAVTGGMLGALLGYSNIEKISAKILTFDQDVEGIQRAEFLN